MTYWVRISRLDINNPDFNKPLNPYPKNFEPTCETLEECIQKALPSSSFRLIMNDMPDVEKKYWDTNVQKLVSQYVLTELETKCIIIYTLISEQVGNEGEKPYQLYALFTGAYRTRDEVALLQFADYSFHFWNGLAKLPKAQEKVLFRGLDKRLEQINDMYKVGNTVHWHYPSSSTTDKAVAQEFSGGGTLFRFDGITDARSLETFSLFPKQKEFLLPYTSVFEVSVALSCEQANLLAAFGHLPPEVSTW